MKFLENYNTYSKKNQDYKLISGHNNLLKKLNLNSSILSYKSISIIGIYKIFKSLLLQDNIHLSDEYMMLIVIYVLSNKLKLNLELTKKLQIELESEIPDFNTLVKKFTHSLHTIFVIVNMIFKKDNIVIGNFEKLLKIKIILKVLNLINDFIIEQNISLHKFSYLIYEKNQEVLKDIVKFVDGNSDKDNIGETFETINYNFKNKNQEQHYKPSLDKINNAKVGDILPNEVIYNYVQYLSDIADKYEECFVDGDLGERLDDYDKYILKEISIDEINLDEFNLNEDDVEEYMKVYLKNNEYPPIVVGYSLFWDRTNDKIIPTDDYSIIDGNHRANSLKRTGEKKILAFVGIMNINPK